MDKKSKKSTNRSAASGSYSANSKPYSAKTYKLVTPKDIKIYQPNVVSKRRNIVSA